MALNFKKARDFYENLKSNVQNSNFAGNVRNFLNRPVQSNTFTRGLANTGRTFSRPLNQFQSGFGAGNTWGLLNVPRPQSQNFGQSLTYGVGYGAGLINPLNPVNKLAGVIKGARAVQPTLRAIQKPLGTVAGRLIAQGGAKKLLGTGIANVAQGVPYSLAYGTAKTLTGQPYTGKEAARDVGFDLALGSIPLVGGLAIGAKAKGFKNIPDKFVGAFDKKLRAEISDLSSRIKTSNLEGLFKQGTARLGELLDHKALYKNYPELAQLKIRFNPQADYKGAFDPNTFSIVVNPNAKPGQIRSTLLHEVQHVIQQIEGFARGGSLKTAPQAYSQELKSLQEKIVNAMRRGNNAEVMRLQDKLKSRYQQGLEKGYRNLAGEIEARAVQLREGMTSAQRKRNPFYAGIMEKEGINPRDVTVNYGKGTQQSLYDTNTILKRVRELIPDKEFYVVGSRAGGKVKPTSDIDILFPNEFDISNKQFPALKKELENLGVKDVGYFIDKEKGLGLHINVGYPKKGAIAIDDFLKPNVNPKVVEELPLNQVKSVASGQKPIKQSIRIDKEHYLPQSSIANRGNVAQGGLLDDTIPGPAGLTQKMIKEASDQELWMAIRRLPKNAPELPFIEKEFGSRKINFKPVMSDTTKRGGLSDVTRKQVDDAKFIIEKNTFKDFEIAGLLGKDPKYKDVSGIPTEAWKQAAKELGINEKSFVEGTPGNYYALVPQAGSAPARPEFRNPSNKAPLVYTSGDTGLPLASANSATAVKRSVAQPKNVAQPLSDLQKKGLVGGFADVKPMTHIKEVLDKKSLPKTGGQSQVPSSTSNTSQTPKSGLPGAPASGGTPPSRQPSSKGIVPQDKYAFNINKNRLNIPEVNKKVVDSTVKDIQPELEAVKGSKLKHEEVIEAAKTSDVLKRVVTREETKAFSAALLKTRQAVSAGAMGKGVSKEFIEALKVQSSIAADWGRRGNALAIGADPILNEPVKNEVVKKLLSMGTKADEIINASKNVNFDSPKEVTKFYRQFVKPNIGEIVSEYRYINLLSSPKTHIVNAFSNLLQATVVSPGTKLFSGAIDLIGSTLTGKQRKHYASEIIPYNKGLINSLGEATQNLVKALKGEAFSDRPDVSRLSTGKFGTLQIVPRALEASDAFFRTLIKGAEKEALAYRFTKMGKQISDAKLDSLASDKAAYFVFREALDSSNKSGQGKLLANIDKLTESVYTLRKVPGVSWFIPFVQTPMNILKQGIEYSPLGVATLPGAKDKTEQLGKALLGSSVMAGAAYLSQVGDSTWSAPIGEKDKEAFFASGRQPYSIKIGDQWVSYSRLGPLAYPIAMAAAVKYYTEQDPKASSRTKLEQVGRALSGMAKFFSDQSYVQGIGDLVKTIQGDVTAAKQSVSNIPSQLIPLSSLQGWVARIVDPIYRRPGSVTDSLKTQIPFLSKSVEPYTNPAGLPSERKNLYFNAVSPVTATPSDEKYDKFYKLRVKNSEYDTIHKKLMDAVKAGKVEEAKAIISQNRDVLLQGRAANQVVKSTDKIQRARNTILNDTRLTDEQKQKVLAKFELALQRTSSVSY